MGCASSKENDGASDRNRSIDAQIERDRLEMAREFKLLILGTGESGKSTVLKQLTIMHRGGFGDEERAAYAEIIFSNTIQSMQLVLESIPLLSLSVAEEHEGAKVLVEDIDPDERVVSVELLDALLQLGSDPAVHAVLDCKARWQLNDSAPYFFSEVGRTMREDYMPSDQDIIRSRVRTTGIVETSFMVGKQRYRIFDVGGQRSERKKWVHCFEDVNVLLFLVAISEYDQMLYEDETQSRLSEALLVFDSVANSRWFAKSTLVLFLNKIDLFKEKLPKFSLRRSLPNFKGDELSYDETSAFMKTQFKQLYQGTSLYTHFTCATDSGTMNFTLSAVQDTITRESIRDLL